MRNSSSLDWLRFMHTPNDYRVSPYNDKLLFPIIHNTLLIMDDDKGIAGLYLKMAEGRYRYD